MPNEISPLPLFSPPFRNGQTRFCRRGTTEATTPLMWELWWLSLTIFDSMNLHSHYGCSPATPHDSPREFQHYFTRQTNLVTNKTHTVFSCCALTKSEFIPQSNLPIDRKRNFEKGRYVFETMSNALSASTVCDCLQNKETWGQY